jgi:hypothetical protein
MDHPRPAGWENGTLTLVAQLTQLRAIGPKGA